MHSLRGVHYHTNCLWLWTPLLSLVPTCECITWFSRSRSNNCCLQQSLEFPAERSGRCSTSLTGVCVKKIGFSSVSRRIFLNDICFTEYNPSDCNFFTITLQTYSYHIWVVECNKSHLQPRLLSSCFKAILSLSLHYKPVLAYLFSTANAVLPGSSHSSWPSSNRQLTL